MRGRKEKDGTEWNERLNEGRIKKEEGKKGMRNKE